MKKRGVKPKNKVKIEWSADFAYAIGLLATDGCVSSSMRHISFVSKDIDQVRTFMRCLGINNKIGKNVPGSRKGYTHRVQFGDVAFVRFLLSIGIMPAKSKILGKINVPKRFFFDFLRGCFDGDGTIYSYWDPRWKSSFMFYLAFISAGKNHINWLRSEIYNRVGSSGHITKDITGSIFQLRYAKRDALRIIKAMYYSGTVTSLKRKRLKIKRILAIVGESL